MSQNLRPALIVGFAALLAGGLAAQTPPRFELTIDSIMRGPKLYGYPPSGLRWSGDSRDLYFEWRRASEDEAATYVVSRDGGEPRRLSDEERKKAPPAVGVWDAAHRRVLFVDEGDIVMVDSVARTRRQITRTTGAESNPRWVRGETHVTFVRDNNLVLVPLDAAAGDLVVQLTDVGPPKKEPKLTESQKFLKDEEEKLLGHVKEANEKRKKEEEKKKKASPAHFDLSERQSVVDIALSSDETYAYILVVERPENARTAAVPNFVTESAYTEDIQSRGKVGDAQDKRRLAVLNLKTGKSTWADSAFAGPAPLEPKVEKPSAEKGDAGKPAAEKAEAEENAPAGKDPAKRGRDVRWNMPVFSRDGKLAAPSVRATDNKDRWLVVVDPETGKTRVLDHLHDEAWVREGFGAAINHGFLPDDRRLFFLSERDGWMHLYTVDATKEGAASQQLTSGGFELSEAELSLDKKKFYFVSTEVHPGERHVYSMPIEGGPRTRLTTMAGSNTPSFSPDESRLALMHSFSNQPPEVYVGPLKPGAPAKQITTSPTEEWRSFRWLDPRLVTFKARDGAEVFARLYTPEMLGAARATHPAGVVFIHGAGYAQNAHRYWSTYSREYMFHHLLAARGFVVLDVDYRGSAGYGRDWRTAIYRHMGGKDQDDIVDGARYLVEKEGADPRRLGVYGGSYGGFLTLMALFTSPETFAAGAALRPVTDWAHYNHPYTANILNEPQRDAEAYRRSSPIYFAEGLKGALLICHGMVDTNVHFQDSVRLAQRLIELRKPNWELAVFPVENHGFDEETSWADEYRRILRLFETNLGAKTP